MTLQFILGIKLGVSCGEELQFMHSLKRASFAPSGFGSLGSGNGTAGALSPDQQTALQECLGNSTGAVCIFCLNDHDRR